ncbi:MAG: hypothetical protein Q7S13_04570 [Candidatus Omnitrophota bacterium]|jgi:hypothetical protein|nr:hypothetical protein [Candidatus Omnitrophota bacterium]
MTRDDIYDHLAQVYLGKRKKDDGKKERQLNAWLVINFGITLIIFASAFYGLTAFLTKQGSHLRENIIYSLHEGPIRLAYDFKTQGTPVQRFSLTLPSLDAARYKQLRFALRGWEGSGPGIVKVVIVNARNEQSYYYLQGVDKSWQEFQIPLETFKQISDWSNVKTISFELESWNVQSATGVLLIENIRLTS